MQTARRHLRIPIHVLIRPRPGNFEYSDRELEIMRNDIAAAKQLNMDGVVLGILQKDARVDIERTKALVELARPLPVTFHRAFDTSQNMEASLEDVIKTGASRILTSGGQARASDAIAILTQLVRLSRERILIMPCGGVNSENVVQIIRTTLAQEVHSSAGASNPESDGNAGSLPQGNNQAASSLHSRQFEQKVATMVSLLGSVPHDEPVS